MRALILSLGFSVMLMPATHAAGPIVIAHRGSSGYLPEHTLEAIAYAHAQGADYLEQDLVLSKDRVPVVLHDVQIDTVTDVAGRFPDRARDDGRFYAIDFTLAELKTLKVNERIDPKTGKAVFPDRFPVGRGTFRIPTFEEELELIAGLNRATGRRAGIYPEIKSPGWHREQGVEITPIVLEVLGRHGYTSKDDPCFLQCFEYDEVRKIRDEHRYAGRLIQLMGSPRGPDGLDMTTAEGLDQLVGRVDGIGPGLNLVVRRASGGGYEPTDLVRLAHDRNLQVHPYTVRADALPPGVDDVAGVYRLLFDEAKVDGLFTDHPDTAVRFLRR